MQTEDQNVENDHCIPLKNPVLMLAHRQLLMAAYVNQTWQTQTPCLRAVNRLQGSRDGMTLRQEAYGRPDTSNGPSG